MSSGLLTENAERRHKLIVSHIGSYPERSSWRHRRDYEKTYKILDECIGEREVSGQHIFMRCQGCSQIRCSRHIQEGACRNCGGRMLNNLVGKLTTDDAKIILKRGF